MRICDWCGNDKGLEIFEVVKRNPLVQIVQYFELCEKCSKQLLITLKELPK